MLISPILTYFTDGMCHLSSHANLPDSISSTEITHLTVAQDDISNRFNSVPEPVSALDSGEVRAVDISAIHSGRLQRTFGPFGMNEALEQAYKACEGYRQSTATPDTQDLFARYREEMKGLVSTMDYVPPSLGTLLPEVGGYIWLLAENRQLLNELKTVHTGSPFSCRTNSYRRRWNGMTMSWMSVHSRSHSRSI